MTKLYHILGVNEDMNVQKLIDVGPCISEDDAEIIIKELLSGWMGGKNVHWRNSFEQYTILTVYS